MKIKTILIVVVSMLLGGAVWSDWNHSANYIWDVPLADRQQWLQVMERRTEAALDVTVFMEEAPIPYLTAEKQYLISQSMTDQIWEGTVTTDEGYLLLILQPEIEKQKIIATGTSLSLMIYDEDHYEIRQIQVSGLPVIALHSDCKIEKEWYGQLTLLGPNDSGRGSLIEAQQWDCSYHIRGLSVMSAPKKSYKMHLLDENGQAAKTSFLGMYNDNDWILNPLYFDESRMREKLGYDFWNWLSNDFQHQMKYVELVLDGQYRGIYALQEVVENKTFGTSKENGYLYSTKFRTDEKDRYEHYLYGADALKRCVTRDGLIDEFQIEKYPQGMLEESIERLRVLKSAIYQLGYESSYQVRFDQDNFVNYSLLLNMAMVIDNGYKNQKFIIRDWGDREYLVQKTPWDLDFSFQNEQLTQYNPSDDTILKDTLYWASNEEDVYSQEIKERYAQCRALFYNMDVLSAQIDQYYELLTESGSIARDRALWPGTALEDNVQYLKTFLEKRISILDSYYGYSDGIQE